MRYRPDIDGLRAIAIVPVILFHAGFVTFSGGYIGVDIFFVISGYLIATTIVEEKTNNAFSLIKFYERRARRILPALFLVMFACIPFSWFLQMPEEMRNFSKSLIFVITFISNIFFWKNSGYFEPEAELKPLLHTWSLSVEEQFYLIFPLTLMIIWPLRKNYKITIIILGFSLSLFLAQIGINRDPVKTFFTLHNRAWELLLGVGAAFYLAKKNPYNFSHTVSNLVALVGLILILISIFMFNRYTPSPSIVTVIPTVGAFLIIIFESKKTITYKILSSPILVHIGLISYSAYLLHQPVFVYFRLIGNQVGGVAFAALSCAVFGAAYLIWRFIETPFRDKRRFKQKSIFIMSALGFIFFATFGVVGNYSKGFEKFYIANRISEEELRRYELIQKNTAKDLSKHMAGNGKCVHWTEEIDSQVESKFLDCARTHGKATVILGDSHAMNIFNILSKINHEEFMFGFAKAGCRPNDGNPNCHYEVFNQFLSHNHHYIDLIIYHQSGSYLMQDTMGRVDSNLIFDTNAPFIFREGGFQETSSYLKNIARFSRVYWWGPFVEGRVNFKDFKNLRQNLTVSKNSIHQFTLLDVHLKRLTEGVKDFDYISMIDALNIQENFLHVGSCITYNDSDHFSDCGETLVGEKLAKSSIYRAFRHPKSINSKAHQ